MKTGVVNATHSDCKASRFNLLINNVSNSNKITEASQHLYTRDEDEHAKGMAFHMQVELESSKQAKVKRSAIITPLAVKNTS